MNIKFRAELHGLMHAQAQLCTARAAYMHRGGAFFLKELKKAETEVKTITEQFTKTWEPK